MNHKSLEFDNKYVDGLLLYLVLGIYMYSLCLYIHYMAYQLTLWHKNLLFKSIRYNMRKPLQYS